MTHIQDVWQKRLLSVLNNQFNFYFQTQYGSSGWICLIQLPLPKRQLCADGRREDKSDSSGGCRCSEEEVNHSEDALIDSSLTWGDLTIALTIQLSLELSPVDLVKMLC